MKTTLPKAILIVLWILIVVNLLVSFPGWLSTILKVLGIFLVIAHLVECFMFSNKIRINHENSFVGYLQVFLFGVVHLNTLPDFKQ
ncbi:MAG: DUF1145 domain-containing protein [Pseudomonadales bacterium]